MNNLSSRSWQIFVGYRISAHALISFLRIQPTCKVGHKPWDSSRFPEFPMLSYKISESKISLVHGWPPNVSTLAEGVENSSKSRKFGTVTMHQSIPAVPLPHSRPISGHEHLIKLGNSQGWGQKRRWNALGWEPTKEANAPPTGSSRKQLLQIQ